MNTPIYIIEESKLRRNLKLIADVAANADIEIILASSLLLMLRRMLI